MYEYLYANLIGKPTQFGEFAEAGFTVYPTWEKLIARWLPWTETEEDFEKWRAGKYYEGLHGPPAPGTYGAITRD
jgi:hypothetical protein